MKKDFNNPGCDKQLGVCVPGEVRVLPTSGEANAIVCRSCFEHDLDWRRDQNDLEQGPDEQFPIPDWDGLKVYEA